MYSNQVGYFSELSMGAVLWPVFELLDHWLGELLATLTYPSGGGWSARDTNFTALA